MLAFDVNNDFGVGDGVLDLGVFEAESTWFIIVENSNFTGAVNVSKFGSIVKQFNKEIFIGLVTIVIYNMDLNISAFLSRFESKDAVDGFIIIRRSSCVVTGSNSDFTCNSLLVFDCNDCDIVGFTDGQMEAFESPLEVTLGLVIVCCHDVLFSVLLTLFDGGTGLSNGIHLTVDGSLHQRLTLEDIFHFSKLNVSNTCCTEFFLEEIFHFGGLLFVKIVLPDFSLFFRDQMFIDLFGSEWNRGSKGSWIVSFSFYTVNSS